LSGPKLLINATTFATRVANWLPKFDGILFFSLGPTKIISNLGQIEKDFFFFGLDS
jgi:hypothetical protein